MGRRVLNRRGRLAITISVFLVALFTTIGGVALANYDWIRAQYLKFVTLDFEGPGVGEVIIRIDEGEDGVSVAQKLVDAGVVRDFDSFYRFLIDENPVFYPGSFRLKLEMTNQAALNLITNPANAITYKITIPEGFRAIQIFEEIERVSGISKTEIIAEAENLAEFGIPADAPTIEGYLFPATYSFDTEASARDILQTMVSRMFQELDSQGVAIEDRHEVLTLASIVQREAKLRDDFYKVSRVFANRLAIDMRLETDPTISYSYDGTDMSEKSRKEQLEYGFNTYLVKGLPPGPISSPGSLALDATLNPADGDWLFFVTIDLRSGETKFSRTLAQHEEYVKLLRQWEKENPDWYDE